MQALYSYRWWLAALVGAMLIAGLPMAKQAVVPNNALSIWFNKHDPALQAHLAYQRDFGNDRIIFVAVEVPGGVLKPGVLRQLRQFSQRIEAIPGVKSVASLLNARDFRRIRSESATRIRFTTWFDDSISFSLPPGRPEEILKSPLVVNRFINPAGDVTTLTITLEPIHKVERHIHQILEGIDKAAKPFPGETQIHLSGSDVLNDGLNQLSRRDFVLFAALGFLLMFIVCGLFYRKIVYLLLVVMVCALSILASLEIHGLLGFQFTIFTIICPPLHISIGIIAAMHILNEYEHLLADQPDADRAVLTRQTLRNIARPAMFAMLTTIIGFASLYTSPTAALREFSLLASSGTAFIFLFSLLFSSLLLPLHRGKSLARKDLAGVFMGHLAGFIMQKARLFTLMCIAVLAASVVGIFFIRNDLEPLGYFPDKHRLIRDHQFLESRWGPCIPVDMVVQTSDSLDLRYPSVILGMLHLRKEIEKMPVVNNSFDFTTLMERYVQVAYPRKTLEGILSDPMLSNTFVDQFMAQLQEQGAGIITPDLRKARLTVIGPMMGVRKLEENLVLVEAAARKHLGQQATLIISGYPSLFLKVMNYAFTSMESGLYSALVLVFISMLLMLRSLRMALIALAPNVFPVVLLLGFLGFSDINLDLATCTVTAIVMGIAIDDTIYFLNKFQWARKSGLGLLDSIEHAHHRVGKVILVSSLVMAAGFAVMLAASLKTVVYFGLLSVVAVVAALLGDLIVLPLLLKVAGESRKSKT